MRFKLFKYISYCFLVLLLPFACFANSLPETKLFAQGNALYAKSAFRAALNNYEELVSRGYQSAPLYYNMGNASYKLNDFPSAILYYEKAHKLDAGDNDININLQLANQKITDKINEAPEFFISRWWKLLILSFPVDTLGIASVTTILLGSGLLILYFFAETSSTKRYAFFSAISLFVFGLVMLLIANRQSAYFNNYKAAIVFGQSVNVKSAPSSNSKNIVSIHSGTKVNIAEANEDWIRINLPNGTEGWIRSADVKEI